MLTPKPSAHCSASGYGVGQLQRSKGHGAQCEPPNVAAGGALLSFAHPTIERKPFIDSTAAAPLSEWIISSMGVQSTWRSRTSLVMVSMRRV
jgi:hypothetical protein